MAGGYRMDRDVEVPMRDGMILRADVYLPLGDGPWPALLMRTPYDKSGAIDPAGGPDERRATAAGYAVVRQDTRGRYASDGTFAPFEAEADDGYDTVEWVAAQPWCDGNVGMIGASYVGYTQWMAAARRPPHLKAIAPVVATSDLHDFWIHEGGAPSLWFNQSWIMGSLGPDMTMRAFPGDTDRLGRLITAVDQLGDHLPDTPGAIDPALDDAGLATAYRTWVDHPERDDYWRALSPRESWAAIEVPSFNVAGWFDCFIGGSLANYHGMRAAGATPAAREGQRLLVGPWRHAFPLLADPAGDAVFGIASGGLGVDMPALHLRFFDRWLKGIVPAAEEAPVKLFVMGANVWRDEPAWPLERAVVTDHYLRSGGRANTDWGDGFLSTVPPTADELPDTFVSDPNDPVPTAGGNLCCWQAVQEPGAFDQRDVEARDDVLVYTSPPLEADLEVTGPVSLTVFVSSTAPDFDVTAKLVDVFPDGLARNVCEGIRRARYRNGTAPGQAALLPPGEVAEIEVDLIATSNVFKAGHRIRLEVAASNWPRFDRNSQTGGPIAGETELRAARQTVYHDAARPSRLRLPIVPA